MKKIVIVAGDSEGYEGLIECLKILFPESEIQVISKEKRISEHNGICHQIAKSWNPHDGKN